MSQPEPEQHKESLAGVRAKLMQELSASSSQVRFHAAWGLGGLAREPGVVEALIRVLAGDADAEVRYAAAHSLGVSGDVRAVEPLIQALEDEAWQVRSTAARSLSALRDERAVEPLIRALQDREGCVRSTAAEALGPLRDERAREPLRQAPNDEDFSVYSEAAEALAHFGELGPLIAGLHHENVGVRLSAAKALWWAGTEETLPLLMWVAEHDPYEATWVKDETVREVAAEAIRLIKHRQRNALI